MGYFRSGDNRSRRYARALNRVQSGIWGRAVSKDRSELDFEAVRS